VTEILRMPPRSAPRAASLASRPDLTDHARCIEFVQTNPKKRDSQAGCRYEQYKGSETIGEALRSGACPGDLRHDLNKGFLRFTDRRLPDQDTPEASHKGREESVLSQGGCRPGQAGKDSREGVPSGCFEEKHQRCPSSTHDPPRPLSPMSAVEGLPRPDASPCPASPAPTAAQPGCDDPLPTAQKVGPTAAPGAVDTESDGPAPDERCMICLESGRCAHIAPHGSKTQRCGGHPVCLACARRIVETTQRNGQFRCPICKQNLGGLRRAMSEGSSLFHWKEAQHVMASTPLRLRKRSASFDDVTPSSGADNTSSTVKKARRSKDPVVLQLSPDRPLNWEFPEQD